MKLCTIAFAAGACLLIHKMKQTHVLDCVTVTVSLKRAGLGLNTAYVMPCHRKCHSDLLSLQIHYNKLALKGIK